MELGSYKLNREKVFDLFSSGQAPGIYYLTMALLAQGEGQHTGTNILDADTETGQIEVFLRDTLNVATSESTMHKLMAAITGMTSDAFESDPTGFQMVSLGLRGVVPDEGLYRTLLFEEAFLALVEIGIIRGEPITLDASIQNLYESLDKRSGLDFDGVDNIPTEQAEFLALLTMMWSQDAVDAFKDSGFPETIYGALL